MFKSKASRAAERAANASQAKQQAAQQFRQDYFGECHRTYSCIHCRAHLANHDELISKLFQGNHGRAYLFNKVVNVGCKQAVQRELLTGLHAVADIYCDSCETTLGWKYEQAFVPSQKYKEGKYIIELVHMLKENNWDLTSYNARQLLDETSATLAGSARLEAARRAPARTFYHKQYNQVNQNNQSQIEQRNQQRSSGAEHSNADERLAIKQRAPMPANRQPQAPRQSAPTVISDATIGRELVELIERSSKQVDLASRRTKSLPKENGDCLSRNYSRSQDSSLLAPKGSLCSYSSTASSHASSGSSSPLSSSSGSAASSDLASEVGGEHLDAPEPTKADSAREPSTNEVGGGDDDDNNDQLNSASTTLAVVVVVGAASDGSNNSNESN